MPSDSSDSDEVSICNLYKNRYTDFLCKLLSSMFLKRLSVGRKEDTKIFPFWFMEASPNFGLLPRGIWSSIFVGLDLILLTEKKRTLSAKILNA